MSTVIKFDDETAVAVAESLDKVQDAWNSADGRHRLLHLTRNRDGVPVRINADQVAYFYERPESST